jgi:hypothetical protein
MIILIPAGEEVKNKKVKSKSCTISTSLRHCFTIFTFLFFTFYFLYGFYLNLCKATSQETQLTGCFFAEVDDTFIAMVQTVGYAHDHRAPIAEVGHFNIRAQGTGIMGGRHGTVVKYFAAGGFTAIELVGIITGRSTTGGFFTWLFRAQKQGLKQEGAANGYYHYSYPLYYLPFHGRKGTKTMPKSLRGQPLRDRDLAK